MNGLSGTMWKAVEAFAYDSECRALPSPFGQHPIGFIMFDEKRMIGALTDTRPSVADALSREFVAYTGTYRFDGTELVTSPDAASRPSLLAEQVRHIRFESPTRMAITPQNDVLGRPIGLTLIWERVEVSGA